MGVVLTSGHDWRGGADLLAEGLHPPLFGSADIINVCNLKCVHCYWWTNRQPRAGELTPEQWRVVIQNSFKKMKIANVTVVGKSRCSGRTWSASSPRR
jgi:MoaA/NifB/PqqE/SkfB family radical SAM enzyme